MFEPQLRHLILVIEHDLWMRMSLASELSRAGYQVRSASNGFTGLRLAQHPTPDVIVMGERLSELSSSELCQQLQRQPETCHIPVVSLGMDTSCALNSASSAVHAALAGR
jgi:DNA-binding response OmpR family regulator